MMMVVVVVEDSVLGAVFTLGLEARYDASRRWPVAQFDGTESGLLVSPSAGRRENSRSYLKHARNDDFSIHFNHNKAEITIDIFFIMFSALRDRTLICPGIHMCHSSAHVFFSFIYFYQHEVIFLRLIRNWIIWPLNWALSRPNR